MSLRIVPVSFADAVAFVAEWHRHHAPPVGHKFSLGVARERVLCGVAIVGRPVVRHLDNGRTLEVNRTATDGTPNANSMLYGASWRAAKALGYDRLVTYTQAGESGASLRAAGWQGGRRTLTTAGLGRPVEAAGDEERQRPALPVGGVMTWHETARQRAARHKRNPLRGAQIAPSHPMPPVRCECLDLRLQHLGGGTGACLRCDCTEYREATT